jgi:hypothetical protein
MLGLALALWLAPPARADGAPPPAFGPTSIAVPVGGYAASSDPRLVRQPSAYPALPRRRRWHITHDAWRPRGPLEIRDEWMFAQPRLTLPAVSPDPVPRGEWLVEVHVDRGNDFGYNQSGPAENPTDRRFLVDGEHQTTEVDARYGLYDKLSLGVRVPIHWRGAGFMDGPIDWFHNAGKGIGLLDNGRPYFRNDHYRVNGRSPDGTPFSWDDKHATALGNVEFEAHWNFLAPCCRSDWRAAWILRMALPTGGDPYDSGFDVGTQVAVAKSLAQRWDVYAGLGATWYSDTTLDGVGYESFRVQGFAAVEFALNHRASLIVESNAGSRLIKSIAAYPGISWYLNVELRLDLTQHIEWQVGFTENLEDQQGTIDFGGFTGLTFRF